MNLFHLLAAFAAGLALGWFYFGLLWVTVRRLAGARRPWALSLLSFWGRLAATLAGFYLASQGRWEYLAACLAGFFLLRGLLIRRHRPRPAGLPAP